MSLKGVKRKLRGFRVCAWGPHHLQGWRGEKGWREQRGQMGQRGSFYIIFIKHRPINVNISPPPHTLQTSHTCALPPGGKVVRGSKGGKGSGGMLCYVLGCPSPLTPTFVPSHQCNLPTLFAYILPSKFPHLCPPTKGGEGSEGEQGWWGEHKVCYTTFKHAHHFCLLHLCPPTKVGDKGSGGARVAREARHMLY